jgi:hypothetical protein
MDYCVIVYLEMTPEKGSVQDSLEDKWDEDFLSSHF